MRSLQIKNLCNLLKVTQRACSGAKIPTLIIPVGALNHFALLLRPLVEREPKRLRGKLTQSCVLYNWRGGRGQGTGEFGEKIYGVGRVGVAWRSQETGKRRLESLITS